MPNPNKGPCYTFMLTLVDSTHEARKILCINLCELVWESFPSLRYVLTGVHHFHGIPVR